MALLWEQSLLCYFFYGYFMVSDTGMCDPDGHRCASRSLWCKRVVVKAIPGKYGTGYSCGNDFFSLGKAVLAELHWNCGLILVECFKCYLLPLLASQVRRVQCMRPSSPVLLAMDSSAVFWTLPIGSSAGSVFHSVKRRESDTRLGVTLVCSTSVQFSSCT